MPPSAIVHLSFMTIEATTTKEKLVGFSYFPIFIDKDTKMPYLKDNVKSSGNDFKTVLHKGNYQMPIYCEYPQMSNSITYKNFINLERIPTASVLLRLDYASIDDDGHFISINDKDPKIREMAYEPPPKYEEQAYSTAYYLNSKVEREVFAVRKQRKTDAPLKEVLTEVCGAMG